MHRPLRPLVPRPSSSFRVFAGPRRRSRPRRSLNWRCQSGVAPRPTSAPMPRRKPGTHLGHEVLVAILLAFAGLALGGCEEESAFAECTIPSQVDKACSARADGTVYTCLFEHPECIEGGLCATWQGSKPFCTGSCDPLECSAGDICRGTCPAGATCLASQDRHFCVPDECDPSDCPAGEPCRDCPEGRKVCAVLGDRHACVAE